MHVNVVDRLSAVFAGVHDKAKPSPAASLAANCRRNCDQAPCSGRVALDQVGDRCMMRAGQHERVGRRLRVHVGYCDDTLVFLEHRCGNLTRADSAENAARHQRDRMVNDHDFVVVFPASSLTRTVTCTGPSRYAYEGRY